MANGDIHKIGTFYMDTTKIKRPKNPWYPTGTPTGTTASGDIYNYYSGNLNFKDTDSSDDYALNFVEVSYANKLLYICDRVLISNITYDTLSAQNLVNGSKIIKIDGVDYYIRVMSNEEWDNIIQNKNNIPGLPIPSSTDLDGKMAVEDLNSETNKLWNWYGIHMITSDKSTSFDTANITRGYSSISNANQINRNAKDIGVGFRPVLIKVNSEPALSIKSSDMGGILNFNDLSYNVIDYENNNFTLIEKLDGVEIRNLSNQSSGTSYTLSLSTQWASIEYGKHQIDIIATDSTGLSTTVVIKFTKIKEPLQKLTNDATLTECSNFIIELNKELSYQNLRIASNLRDMGVTTNSDDTLSSLIDKMSNVTVYTNLPGFFNPKNIWIEGPRPPEGCTSSSYYSVRYENKIYDFSNHKDIFVYDIITETWSTVNTISHGTRTYVDFYCINRGTIYSVGGGNGSTKSNEIWAYNIANNTWTRLADAPGEIYNKPWYKDGDNIYILDMYNNSGTKSFKYNIQTNTWTNISTRSLNVGGYCYKHRDIIYVWGGESNGYTLSRYNTATNAWLSDLTIPTNGASNGTVRYYVDFDNFMMLGFSTNGRVTGLDPATNVFTILSNPGAFASIHPDLSNQVVKIDKLYYILNSWDSSLGSDIRMFNITDYKWTTLSEKLGYTTYGGFLTYVNKGYLLLLNGYYKGTNNSKPYVSTTRAFTL